MDSTYRTRVQGRQYVVWPAQYCYTVQIHTIQHLSTAVSNVLVGYCKPKSTSYYLNVFMYVHWTLRWRRYERCNESVMKSAVSSLHLPLHCVFIASSLHLHCIFIASSIRHYNLNLSHCIIPDSQLEKFQLGSIHLDPWCLLGNWVIHSPTLCNPMYGWLCTSRYVSSLAFPLESIILDILEA